MDAFLRRIWWIFFLHNYFSLNEGKILFEKGNFLLLIFYLFLWQRKSVSFNSTGPWSSRTLAHNVNIFHINLGYYGTSEIENNQFFYSGLKIRENGSFGILAASTKSRHAPFLSSREKVLERFFFATKFFLLPCCVWRNEKSPPPPPRPSIGKLVSSRWW